ncbi:hypothetical protein GRI75_13180 [Altererythrobacter soli]|uniref:DUF885 domain-containing protein n=1 Tax=Croceibacterium soli TaxID=1739690 RepID=A0A6I4UUJ3_9SPHN|nr:hypothetical protein [Croceibacterium soli]MXP42592.1 hypothetical protein [Croceibacterium soli]
MAPLLLALLSLPLHASPSKPSDVDSVARAYIELALGAYLLNGGDGDVATPRQEELARAKAAKRSAAQIAQEAAALVEALDALPAPPDRLTQMRHRSLRARLVSLEHGQRPADANTSDVADDVRLRFGFTADFPALSDYDAALARLDAAMPGPGTLPERIAALRATAAVTPERIEPVFRAAVAECRRRTAPHLDLAEESVDIRFVPDDLTPAQAEYVGGGKSIVSISTVIPTDVDRLLQHACHEVYPGHHAHMLALDRELYRLRGWPEYGAAMAADPVIPAAEAIAEYGVGLAFPVDERIAFQRDVLYPLAGLTMRNEEQWRAYLSARPEVLGATATVARDFLSGAIDEETAVTLLMRYRLQSREAARQTAKMIGAFGSYLIASDFGWFAVDRALRDKPREEQWRLLKQLQREPALLEDVVALGAGTPD